MALQDPGIWGIRVEYVSAASGEQKTRTAIRIALLHASMGAKIMIAMPTLVVVEEMSQYANELSETHYGGAIPVTKITSEQGAAVVQRIRQHVDGGPGAPQGGQLLFITHEALNRMAEEGWPDNIYEWELIIDEEMDVVLTRSPLKLRESYFNLTAFLRAVPTYGLARATEKEEKRLEHLRAVADPQNNASENEQRQARGHIDRMINERKNREILMSYYSIVPKQDARYGNRFVEIRRDLAQRDLDDVYKLFDPIPRWLLAGYPCFTAAVPWDRMVDKSDRKFDRGIITISAIRRPDALAQFRRVTIMSALFEHGMLHDLWAKLGVQFVRSEEINVTKQQTDLRSRRLRIYYLCDDGWSKHRRDKIGGIGKVLGLVRASGAIDANKPVCVLLNKDDGGEGNDAVVAEYFPHRVMMPHNSRGQNRFRQYDQLIYCAALNPYTPDIRWIEEVLEINSMQQRIARAGAEFYQTAMRTSLRDPTATRDVALVVMDRNVAEWAAQWFTPAENVEVHEIDTGGILRKGKPGRPMIGNRPMTAAERKARSRERKRQGT